MQWNCKVEYLVYLIFLASGKGASTYGYNESLCGEQGKPVKCNAKAQTASGLFLEPHLPIVALSMKEGRRLPKGIYLRVRINEGPCIKVLLADKKNPRYKETQPWDVTPAVLKKAGISPSPTWSGELSLCSVHLKDGRIFYNR